MGKVTHAIGGAFKTITHGVKEFAHDPLEGPRDLFNGLDDMVHGDFKGGLGEIMHSAKRTLDPFHAVGAAHQAARPITDPINKGLAKGIKGLTGHNVLGSHPLNTVGTVVASVFTGGAAAAVAGGASFAGAMSAGVSALESAGASALGAVGTGLTNVGLTSAGTAVSGAATSLASAATSAMAASGTIAGQMGLSGMQAVEMNMGSGLTKLGTSIGNNMIGNAIGQAGTNMTGAVSEQLVAQAGTGSSFGFVTGADGSSKMLTGTVSQLTKAGVSFPSTGSNAILDYAKSKAKSEIMKQVTGSMGGGQEGGNPNGQDPDGIIESGSADVPSMAGLLSSVGSGDNQQGGSKSPFHSFLNTGFVDAGIGQPQYGTASLQSQSPFHAELGNGLFS